MRPVSQDQFDRFEQNSFKTHNVMFDQLSKQQAQIDGHQKVLSKGVDLIGGMLLIELMLAVAIGIIYIGRLRKLASK